MIQRVFAALLSIALVVDSGKAMAFQSPVSSQSNIVFSQNALSAISVFVPNSTAARLMVYGLASASILSAADLPGAAGSGAVGALTVAIFSDVLIWIRQTASKHVRLPSLRSIFVEDRLAELVKVVVHKAQFAAEWENQRPYVVNTFRVSAREFIQTFLFYLNQRGHLGGADKTNLLEAFSDDEVRRMFSAFLLVVVNECSFVPFAKHADLLFSSQRPSPLIDLVFAGEIRSFQKHIASLFDGHDLSDELKKRLARIAGHRMFGVTDFQDWKDNVRTMRSLRQNSISEDVSLYIEDRLLHATWVQRNAGYPNAKPPFKMSLTEFVARVTASHTESLTFAGSVPQEELIVSGFWLYPFCDILIEGRMSTQSPITMKITWESGKVNLTFNGESISQLQDDVKTRLQAITEKLNGSCLFGGDSVVLSFPALINTTRALAGVAHEAETVERIDLRSIDVAAFMGEVRLSGFGGGALPEQYAEQKKYFKDVLSRKFAENAELQAIEIHQQYSVINPLNTMIFHHLRISEKMFEGGDAKEPGEFDADPLAKYLIDEIATLWARKVPINTMYLILRSMNADEFLKRFPSSQNVSQQNLREFLRNQRGSESGDDTADILGPLVKPQYRSSMVRAFYYMFVGAWEELFRWWALSDLIESMQNGGSVDPFAWAGAMVWAILIPWALHPIVEWISQAREEQQWHVDRLSLGGLQKEFLKELRRFTAIPLKSRLGLMMFYTVTFLIPVRFGLANPFEIFIYNMIIHANLDWLGAKPRLTPDLMRALYGNDDEEGPILEKEPMINIGKQIQALVKAKKRFNVLFIDMDSLGWLNKAVKKLAVNRQYITRLRTILEKRFGEGNVQIINGDEIMIVTALSDEEAEYELTLARLEFKNRVLLNGDDKNRTLPRGTFSAGFLSDENLLTALQPGETPFKTALNSRTLSSHALAAAKKAKDKIVVYTPPPFYLILYEYLKLQYAKVMKNPYRENNGFLKRLYADGAHRRLLTEHERLEAGIRSTDKFSFVEMASEEQMRATMQEEGIRDFDNQLFWVGSIAPFYKGSKLNRVMRKLLRKAKDRVYGFYTGIKGFNTWDDTYQAGDLVILANRVKMMSSFFEAFQGLEGKLVVARTRTDGMTVLFVPSKAGQEELIQTAMSKALQSASDSLNNTVLKKGLNIRLHMVAKQVAKAELEDVRNVFSHLDFYHRVKVDEITHEQSTNNEPFSLVIIGDEIPEDLVAMDLARTLRESDEALAALSKREFNPEDVSVTFDSKGERILGHGLPVFVQGDSLSSIAAMFSAFVAPYQDVPTAPGASAAIVDPRDEARLRELHDALFVPDSDGQLQKGVSLWINGERIDDPSVAKISKGDHVGFSLTGEKPREGSHQDIVMRVPGMIDDVLEFLKQESVGSASFAGASLLGLAMLSNALYPGYALPAQSLLVATFAVQWQLKAWEKNKKPVAASA